MKLIRSILITIFAAGLLFLCVYGVNIYSTSREAKQMADDVAGIRAQQNQTASAAPAKTPSPTPDRTEAPTAEPTETPTEAPAAVPTTVPTAAPTLAPTAAPTPIPTAISAFTSSVQTEVGEILPVFAPSGTPKTTSEDSITSDIIVLTPIPTPVCAIPSPTHSSSPVPTHSPTPTPAPTHAPQPDALLAHYASLAAQNPDMVGWIYIEDTPVDYPVMLTPEDPEYYLHRSFERAYAFEGIPFIDSRCTIDPPSDNIIIYAHNMRNGSMFGTLKHYTDEAYFAAHPLIGFDTLTRRGTYRVFAAIPIILREIDDPRMRCYATVMTQDSAMIEGLREYVTEYAACYDLDALPQVGDEVITLSTCTGLTNANRLVVMAVRVDEEESN